MLLTNSIVRWRQKFAGDRNQLETGPAQLVEPERPLVTTAPIVITSGAQAAAATAAQTTKKMQQDWQLSRKYTLSEVQQHCSLDDCWMVIFDKVYNITEFVNEHPGGDFILLEYAGRDATHPFLSSRHGSSAYKMLDKYWIGILVDEELYYSNNSSYCSVYSSLSWRSKPSLEQQPVKMTSVLATANSATTAPAQPALDYDDVDDDDDEEDIDGEEEEEDDDDNQSDLSDESDAWSRAITRTAGQALSQALASRKWLQQR